MPQISVIVPTYNRKERLLSAMASVIGQTFTDWELLVVDDASDDDTGAMPVFFGANPRFVYTRLDTHRGVSAARNRGVSMSRGAWICFLDSDDIWHKDKLMKQVAWHNEHGGYRISQTQEIWIRGGIRVNPPRSHEKIQGFQFRENLQRCMITPSSVMMEKALFAEVGGFNEALPACEDYDLWLKISCMYPIGLVDEKLMTRFGGHPDQLSASITALDRFRIRSILDVLKNPMLTEEQRQWARGTLVEKALIVAQGCKKRGQGDEFEHYNRIARRYGEC